MSTDPDRLRTRLAVLVEEFNAEHEQAERVALHREIQGLRAQLAAAERVLREEGDE